jgi:hypothetical protein
MAHAIDQSLLNHQGQGSCGVQCNFTVGLVCLVIMRAKV